MQHTIIIQYVSGPKLDQKAEYRYDIQLSADQQFKVDYFTGKQRDVQMTALGLALDNALPADAVIKAINYVPFEATKTDFLEMLKRKDDYVATILFETMSETAVDEATDEPADAASQATDTNTVTTDQVKSAVDTAVKTGSQTDTVKKTIEYQPANSHAYQTLDLQQKEPAATEKVRKVGISKLSYVFNYGDLQKIISNDKVDVFQTPIGVVPSNGSITPTRRRTFSENAGLDTAALDDAKVVKLGTVTNSNNQKEYSVYAFEASKQEPKQSKTTTAPASQPETTTAPASQPETTTAPASQPEMTTAPASQPETTTAPASQPEMTTVPASQPETTTAPVSQSETTTVPASQPETATAPASQPEMTTELHALREQIAQLSSKMDNSLVQENNDLAVAFNKIELKLNELTTRLQSPLPTANNNDALDIKQKLDQILTNQAKNKTKQPATLNELIIQQSNLTDADLKQIPNRIKDQCFNHNEKLPIERANYIFQIIAYLKDNFNIPEDLKCLSDPELFLKVVHLLSWFN